MKSGYLPRIPIGQALAIGLSLALAALVVGFATPRAIPRVDHPNLEALIPRVFGDWRALTSPSQQVGLITDNNPYIDRPYDEALMRTYGNGRGISIMLAIAWGHAQRQEIKVHRPDICYSAQGYRIERMESILFRDNPPANHPLRATRMVAMGNADGEAVEYWIRIGSLFSAGPLDTRWHIFTEGLKGRIPDGLLVRVSQRINNVVEAQAAWPVIDGFLRDMLAAMNLDERRLLVR